VKPRYNGFRVFGAVCYIHIPEEKRRWLKPWAVMAHVIGHVEFSKGWLLWIQRQHLCDFSNGKVSKWPACNSKSQQALCKITQRRIQNCCLTTSWTWCI
jgi:hypothetical protein